MSSNQKRRPTDPVKLERYLERPAAEQAGLDPSVRKVVDTLGHWQFATELQPRPTFVGKLAKELQVQQRVADTQATRRKPSPILTRLLIAGAAIVLLLIYATGLFAPPEVEPAAVESSFSNRPYTFYLFDPFEASERFPLNPQTLDDQPDGQVLAPNWFSAGGSTGVAIERSAGRGSLDPEDSWIVIYDLPGGVERNRFHPPVAALIDGLNEDGSRLLLQPYDLSPSPYPPRVEWYVVDTASGEMVAHVRDANNACFRQRVYFEPAGQRLYCVGDPALTGAEGPQPMHITAYEVDSGRITAEIDLPEVLLGGSGIEGGDRSLKELIEPAVALSPNGQRLAIVHADTDKVTLLDAQRLAVERTFSLERSFSLLDLFAPSAANQTGEMAGTVRQAEFSLDGQYLYVFAQQGRMVPGQESPDKRGLWLVDLENGVVSAKALTDYQIQWVKPAPDGTVYVFGTTDERLLPYEIRESSPSMLWRLDALTLEILAVRGFTGYQEGRLVIAQSR